MTDENLQKWPGPNKPLAPLMEDEAIASGVLPPKMPLLASNFGLNDGWVLDEWASWFVFDVAADGRVAGVNSDLKGSWAYIWRPDTGEVVSFPTLYEMAQGFAISPNGEWLAVGSWYGKHGVYSTQTGQLAWKSRHGKARDVRFWPDSQRVLFLMVDRGAYLYDAATGERLHTLSMKSIDKIAISPQGRYWAAGPYYGQYLVLDGQDDSILAKVRLPVTNPILQFHFHHMESALVFSEMAEELINGSVVCWDWQRNALVWEYRSPVGHCIRLAPLGKDWLTLESGKGGARLTLIDGSTGSLLRELLPAGSDVGECLAYPDGECLIDERGCMMRISDGMEVRRLIPLPEGEYAIVENGDVVQQSSGASRWLYRKADS